jgi:hypothetical protein
MTDGKERAIEELKKQCREAIDRADTFRAQAVEYIRSARFEIDKAKGYLKQVDVLAKEEEPADELRRA